LLYPALDVANVDGELVLAVADDYFPTAVEQHDGFLTLFFFDRRHRDAARKAITLSWPRAVTTPHEVDDEDWARRSQQNLEPLTVGQITLVPDPRAVILDPGGITIVIEPSMGFGTGHHATTRLCLTALQMLDLVGRFVLDIGTGSGVLAIAARRLGARQTLGIDNDPDAVRAARANLAVNSGVDGVAFEEADFTSWLRPPKRRSLTAARRRADVVTANLTGALLSRAAGLFAAAVVPGGFIVVSGLLAAERDNVVAAFASSGHLNVVWEMLEDGWVGLTFKSQLTPLGSQVKPEF
jgi:ribosomal protein L11 methyltransferase